MLAAGPLHPGPARAERRAPAPVFGPGGPGWVAAEADTTDPDDEKAPADSAQTPEEESKADSTKADEEGSAPSDSLQKGEEESAPSDSASAEKESPEDSKAAAAGEDEEAGNKSLRPPRSVIVGAVVAITVALVAGTAHNRSARRTGAVFMMPCQHP